MLQRTNILILEQHIWRLMIDSYFDVFNMPADNLFSLYICGRT